MCLVCVCGVCVLCVFVVVSRVCVVCVSCVCLLSCLVCVCGVCVLCVFVVVSRVCVVQPVVSGAAMALSSLCTVGSSLLLWLCYTPPALPKTDAGTRAPTRQMAVGRGKGRAAYNPLYSADVAKECAAERAR